MPKSKYPLGKWVPAVRKVDGVPRKVFIRRYLKNGKSQYQTRIAPSKGFRKMTNKDLLFGDADGDGTPNLDDASPFDPESSSQVSEIMLSEELHKIEDSRGKHLENLVDFADLMERETGRRPEYRVKEMRSAINTLRRKHIDRLSDMEGARFIARDINDLQTLDANIQRALGDNIKQRENIYDLEGGRAGYRAIHYDVVYNGKKVELQLKTKRMLDLAEAYHTHYKRGTGDIQLYGDLSDLAWKADRGDSQAAQVFDRMHFTTKTFESGAVSTETRQQIREALAG